MKNPVMPSTSRRSRVAKPVAAHDAAARLDRILCQVVDAGLAGCIFVVPLLMGGRQALGRLALVSLAVIVAVAWAARQIVRRESTWRHCSAEILILAAIALLVLQIAPLPPSILAKLSPHTAEILPLWGGTSGATARPRPWEHGPAFP